MKVRLLSEAGSLTLCGIQFAPSNEFFHCFSPAEVQLHCVVEHTATDPPLSNVREW